MQIIVARPPNYDEIAKVFPVAGRRILFCYGFTIYNPGGAEVTEDLIEHERVHAGQQQRDIDGWWRRYMDDPEFRLAQEIPAHQVQYQTFAKRAGRNERRQFLNRLATFLSSPLYGNLVSKERAKALIKA